MNRLSFSSSLVALFALLVLPACSSTETGLQSAAQTRNNDGASNNGASNNDDSNNDTVNNNSVNNDTVNNDVANNDVQPSDAGTMGDAWMGDVSADVMMGDAWMGDAPPDVPEGPIPNEGWIGGPCDTAADCTHIDDPICLTGSDFPNGQCSEACDRFCPDLDGENSVTFCIDVDDAGRCAPRCDYDLYPGEGCREGYDCRIVGRFNESSTQNATCVPETWESTQASTGCREMLDDLGVIWTPWDYTTQTAEGTSQTCPVSDPVRVTSPINGIDYRYYNQDTPGTMSVSCDLAIALHRLGDVLHEYNIRAVLHIGTFHCRRIANSQNLSQHSFANAIDIWGFELEGGDRYILEERWEHDTETFQTEAGRVLWEIGQRMYNDRIFNTTLTPNYNSDHDNHYHVDLKEGAHFIGFGESSAGYVIDEGPDACGEEGPLE